jgi:hypothetical protein
MKPQATRTFTHRHVRGAVRQLTCDEFGCEKHANGWATILPETSVQLVGMIRNGDTGRFHQEKIESAGMVTFYFPPGQQCFETHWQRDPIFTIARIDSGGAPRVYSDGDLYVEDSDRHLRQLKEVIDG